MDDTTESFGITAPEISAGDLVRASVSFLASCVVSGEGWSEQVAQSIRNAKAGIAALEAEAQ